MKYTREYKIEVIIDTTLFESNRQSQYFIIDGEKLIESAGGFWEEDVCKMFASKGVRDYITEDVAFDVNGRTKISIVFKVINKKVK